MVYIIYGVSGIGKTTIGKELSNKLSIPFFDADDFHSKENISKMTSGNPLNDEDRKPWLENIATHLKQWNEDSGAVLACSALKESYRNILVSKTDIDQVSWVFLHADFNLIHDRLKKREGHYMKSSMLKSQFNDLEVPNYGIQVNVENNVESVVNEIMSKLNKKPSFGLIGLGVMGKSLALNISNNNFDLSVYNRHVAGVEENIASDFIRENNLTNTLGFDNLKMFVESLERPRNILLMVNAGKPVDYVIDDLTPLLDDGDLIIDGGNSHYLDTKTRVERLKKLNVHFIGMGVSGGEEGALKGPSIMPSGNKEAYRRIENILENISAKDTNNKACCAYVGEDGSGHFIKTIHNGIEYAEMQLIAETYHYLRFFGNLNPIEISDVFNSWKQSGLNSYLLEITIDILKAKEKDEVFLIDNILDKASQKGTGGWSTNIALDLGKPLNTISDSVMARFLSAMKKERVEASKLYNINNESSTIDLHELRDTYKVSRIINHAIGFDTIKAASIENEWNLNLSEIARIWTNGCIIKSELMEDLVDYFKQSDRHLLLNEDIVSIIKPTYNDFKNTISSILNSGCPIPVMSASLNYFLGFTSKQSSANIIQAQRDYFGAHTYQRNDKPEDQFFHTDWKSI